MVATGGQPAQAIANACLAPRGNLYSCRPRTLRSDSLPTVGCSRSSRAKQPFEQLRMTKKSLKSKSVIVQESPKDAPSGWAPVQRRLADSSGLSILLIDGRQPPALVVSENNSICDVLQSSPDHVGMCDPYCGEAYHRAMNDGGVVDYKCHAGLQCFTMPVQIANQRNLAVIGGRAFVSAADYRRLVDRFRGGDLKELIDKDPLSNVIFAERAKLDQLADRLQKAARQFTAETSHMPRRRKSPSRRSYLPGV